MYIVETMLIIVCTQAGALRKHLLNELLRCPKLLATDCVNILQRNYGYGYSSFIFYAYRKTRTVHMRVFLYWGEGEGGET